MSKPQTIPLREMIEPDRGISYGIVQPGSHVSGGIPIIRVSDVKNGEIQTHAPLCVSPDVEARYLRTRLRGGELLITIVGSVGQTAIVPKNLAGWNVARAIAVLPIRGEIGAYWVQLALLDPSVRSRINSRLNTTVQATLNLGDIAELPILVPSIADRDRIASVLRALDDKIDLNRRMNETLEAMARAIFKDWFVDFGPVRAKAEGRPPYLAPDLWALFPDALDDDDKPVGWRLSTIGDEVKVVGGGTPSTTESVYWEGGNHHWVTPKDLSKLNFPVLLKTERKITDVGLLKISSGLLPIGTVLLSSRAPIGYLAIAEVPTAINQGFIAMICNKLLPNLYVLFWCYENLDYIKGISGGSTFAEISKKSFRPIPVIIPSKKLLGSFNSIASPLYRRIVANMQESESLAQLRDLLLPKLMSGEIRLRDAEKAVKQVT